MKERTSNLSLTSLVAGIMSIITVFGGYTAFLGVFFALFGIIAGARGKRIEPTRTAEWAVVISVLGFILCLVVAAALIGLYVFNGIEGAFDFNFNFDFKLPAFEIEPYYQQIKDMIIDLIDRL
ncbi:MAG: hypothetical protein IKV45_03880 [Firmicutes bacterium]|nr:hypothetical protein [Bacillota bacterium]